jgi:hypothetical protein
MPKFYTDPRASRDIHSLEIKVSELEEQLMVAHAAIAALIVKNPSKEGSLSVHAGEASPFMRRGFRLQVTRGSGLIVFRLR